MLVNRSSRDRADTLKQQPAAPTLRDDERSHRTPKNCRITRHRKRLMMLLAQSEADELLLRRAAEADPHSLGHLARPQLRAKRAAGQISKAKEKARLAESSARAAEVKRLDVLSELDERITAAREDAAAAVVRQENRAVERDRYRQAVESFEQRAANEARVLTRINDELEAANAQQEADLEAARERYASSVREEAAAHVALSRAKMEGWNCRRDLSVTEASIRSSLFEKVASSADGEALEAPVDADHDAYERARRGACRVGKGADAFETEFAFVTRRVNSMVRESARQCAAAADELARGHANLDATRALARDVEAREAIAPPLARAVTLEYAIARARREAATRLWEAVIQRQRALLLAAPRRASKSACEARGSWQDHSTRPAPTTPGCRSPKKLVLLGC